MSELQTDTLGRGRGIAADGKAKKGNKEGCGEKMMSEERLDRIEHLTAGWIEQSKKEHEENRLLWRETQRQFKETDARFADQFAQFRDEGREQMQAIRAEMAARDRITDERIGALVTAIGELIQALAREHSNGKTGAK